MVQSTSTNEFIQIWTLTPSAIYLIGNIAILLPISLLSSLSSIATPMSSDAFALPRRTLREFLSVLYTWLTGKALTLFRACAKLGFLMHASRNKPDSSRVVHCITNATACLYLTWNFAIGTAEALPSHIVNKKFAVGMAVYKGRQFKNQHSLWKHLAYHSRCSVSSITRRVKEVPKNY